MKCTLVSLLPFGFYNKVPGLYPGEFRIDRVDPGDFDVLVLDSTLHYIYIDSDRGSIPYKISTDDLAISLVNDFRSSCLAVTENAVPGLFWVEGEYTKEQIGFLHAEELARVGAQQQNWFLNLVRMADDDWEKTHQHKLISDLQRWAAKSLGFERPYLVEVPKIKKQCPICGSNITEFAIICPTCRFILDEDKAATLKFAV